MNIIVTRHAGAVEWLRQQGITGKVISHATEKEVTGQVVYGMLPLHLAALAERVVTIDLPNLAPDQRGNELSADEMEKAGARLVAYKVKIS